jgi:protein-tyrosine phosphatase
VVDLHCHILHGIDDGARSLDESVAMAKVAAGSGTTELVASPHASPQFSYNPQLAHRRWEELQRLAGGKIRIHRGCDYHLTHESLQVVCQQPARYSINGLGYLLVEFPEVPDLDYMEYLLNEVSKAGLLPIVTHPERHQFLAGDVKSLARWVEGGVLLQVTGQSLLGRFGPRAEACARELLNRGLAHFVASDAHDAFGRPPRLDDARTLARALYGDEYPELLFDINPRAVVEGKPILPGPLAPPIPPRKWFGIWKG